LKCQVINFHACWNNSIVFFVPYYFSRNTVLKLRVIVMNFLFNFTSFRTTFYDCQEWVYLTHFLLTWRIWWANNNAGRWDLTRPLTHILLKWSIWWAPNCARKWQMGFNSAFKGLMRWGIMIWKGERTRWYPYLT
jgi:hypothetical protein